MLFQKKGLNLILLKICKLFSEMITCAPLAFKTFINLFIGRDVLNGIQILLERNMLVIVAYISNDLSEKVTTFIRSFEIFFLNFEWSPGKSCTTQLIFQWKMKMD